MQFDPILAKAYSHYSDYPRQNPDCHTVHVTCIDTHDSEYEEQTRIHTYPNAYHNLTVCKYIPVHMQPLTCTVHVSCIVMHH